MWTYHDSIECNAELRAFGVVCSTRYSNAFEMSAMLAFLCELRAQDDGESLVGLIQRLEYDSKADTLCIFNTKQWRVVSESGNAPPKALMDAAMNHFPQWHFYGDNAMVISPKFELPQEAPLG